MWKCNVTDVLSANPDVNQGLKRPPPLPLSVRPHIPPSYPSISRSFGDVKIASWFLVEIISRRQMARRQK